MKKVEKVLKIWSQILVWWVQYRNRIPGGVYSLYIEEDDEPRVTMPHGWVPDRVVVESALEAEYASDAVNSLHWATLLENRPEILTVLPGRQGNPVNLLNRKELCIRVFHQVTADLYESEEGAHPGYEVEGCYEPVRGSSMPCLRHHGHKGRCRHDEEVFPRRGRAGESHLVFREDFDEFLKMADSKRFDSNFKSTRKKVYSWFKNRYPDHDDKFIDGVGPWSSIAIGLLGLFLLPVEEDSTGAALDEDDGYNTEEGDYEGHPEDDEDDDDEDGNDRGRKSQRTQYEHGSSWRSSWWESSSGARGSNDSWRGWSGSRWANSGAAHNHPKWIGHTRYFDRCYPCATQEVVREGRSVAEAYGTGFPGSSPVEACQGRCKPCSPAQDSGSSLEGAGHVDTLSVQPHERALSRAGAAEKPSEAATAGFEGGPSTLVPRVPGESRVLPVDKRVNDVTAETACVGSGIGLKRGHGSLAELVDAVYAPLKRARVDTPGLLKSKHGRGDRVAEVELPPRKLRRGAGSLGTSLMLKGSLLALLPLMAHGMDVAVVGQGTTSALGLMSIAATLAWYVGSGSAVYSLAVAVPEVIDTGVRHIDGVMSEVTFGSCLLIRQAFLLLITVVVIAILIWGSHFLRRVYVYCFPNHKKGRRVQDGHSRVYGGRLPGGTSQVTAQQVLARVGLVGNADPSPVAIRPGQVDLNRLQLGDVVSFVYSRGRRSGMRRSGVVISFPITPTGAQFEIEEDVDGETKCRKYWPSATSGVVYSVENIFRERANAVRVAAEAAAVGPRSRCPCADCCNGVPPRGHSNTPSDAYVTTLHNEFLARTRGLTDPASDAIRHLISRVETDPGSREFGTPENRSDALEEFQTSELVRITRREDTVAPAGGGLGLEDVPPFPDLSSSQEDAQEEEARKLFGKIESTTEQWKRESNRSSSAMRRAESAKEPRGSGVGFWKSAAGLIPKVGTKSARSLKDVELSPAGSSQGTFGCPAPASGTVGVTDVLNQDLPQRLAEAQRMLQAKADSSAWRRGARSVVEYYSGDEMADVMLEELAMAKRSIDGMQLLIDHTSGVTTLVAQICSGVTLRLLLDKGQFQCSSSARQADRIKDLWQAMTRAKKGEIRIMSGRTTGGFAMMHAKTWVIDKRVCLLGSVNLTHNGLENNTENLVRISEPGCILKASKDFEDRWKEAEVVDDALIRKMIEADAARKEKKDDKKREREEDRRSRSKSRPRSEDGRGSSCPRSPSRALAPQFASVVEVIDR